MGSSASAVELSRHQMQASFASAVRKLANKLFITYRKLSRRTLTAHKEHDCLRCKEKIMPGMEYVRESHILENEFWCVKYHVACFLKWMRLDYAADPSN